MSGEYIVFILLAMSAIAGGILLISLNKVMQMMLSLVLTFISIAGIYVMLSAEFVAIVQVMVYAGALAILMIFGIMLTNHHDDLVEKAPLLRRLVILVSVIGFAVVILVGILGIEAPVDTTALYNNNTEKIGIALYSDYIIPFELASIVLLVALVGAIVLAKKDDRQEGEGE